VHRGEKLDGALGRGGGEGDAGKGHTMMQGPGRSNMDYAPVAVGYCWAVGIARYDCRGGLVA
jgi:hypothetical protein